MTFEEKIDPSSTFYTEAEIAEGLKIPLGAIERYRKTGLITPVPSDSANPLYNWKTVQFIKNNFWGSPMASYWYRQNKTN